MEKGNFLGINWQVRAKNPQFWFQIFLGIAVPIGTYFGVIGKDIYIITKEKSMLNKL